MSPVSRSTMTAAKGRRGLDAASWIACHMKMSRGGFLGGTGLIAIPHETTKERLQDGRRSILRRLALTSVVAIARPDPQCAIHLPASMLCVGRRAAGDFEAEILELVGDLGLPTGQPVVESNCQIRPVCCVFVF